MGIYSQQISLINKIQAKKRTEFCLTVYFPNKNYDRRGLSDRVRSFISSNLRKRKEVSALNRLHQKIETQVVSNIYKLDDIKEGVALFLKFDTRAVKKRKINFLRLLALPKEVEKEFNLQKWFDVDQLLWVDEMMPTSLMIKLDDKGAIIYRLTGNKMVKIDSVDNSLVTDRPKDEYLEKVTTNAYKSSFHSTGSDKSDRDKRVVNQLFLNQLLKRVKRKKGYNFSGGYSLIFYSQKYVGLMENFINEWRKIMPQTTVLKMAINFDSKKELKKTAIDKIEAFELKIKKDLLELAKEDYYRFVTGWNKVTGADRQKKIERLFIKAKAKRQGYVLGKNLLYSYPVKNSKMVKNMAPLLVRRVMSNGGQVTVIEKEGLMPKWTVAAQLRY